MYIQIVNFQLCNMTPAEYEQACTAVFADAFRDMPGLISKIWLSNAATNTYGGVYTWQDRAAMEAYQASDLFRSLTSNPNFRGVTSQEFSILEAPTRVTHRLVSEVSV